MLLDNSYSRINWTNSTFGQIATWPFQNNIAWLPKEKKIAQVKCYAWDVLIESHSSMTFVCGKKRNC